MRAPAPLLLLPTLMAQAEAPPLPQGTITPRVACAADARYGYALYIPTSYQRGRPAPVFLGISPVGRGEDPVRLFREAAERHGWILVGPLEARNGPWEPTRAALKAVWTDVRQRFDVDVSRSVVGGMSGGARFALDFLRLHPEFRGLVSIGAFGLGPSSVRGMGDHAAVLLCGETDFNHAELVMGARCLQDRGWRIWADRFPGGHEWPPVPLCGEVLDFFERDAMQRKVRPLDTALIAGFAARRLEAARAATGLLALRRWEALRAEGPSPEADQALKVLEHDPRTRREQELEREANQEMDRVNHVRWNLGYVQLLQKWLVRAQSQDPAEVVFAQRLLGNEILLHRLALQEAFDQKRWDTAIPLARNLSILQPQNGQMCLILAEAQASLGQNAKAVASLREAAARGYRPKQDPRSHPGLQRLKEDPAAEALFATLGFPAAPPS